MTNKTTRTPKDLRAASDDIDAVKRLAADAFGFQTYHVKPLESDPDGPASYCMFEVCGVRYQARGGKLSICECGE